MQIREYQKPATLDEAYALLVKGKTNRILGGCTFLKRTNVKIGTAIDLSACGLDYIRETEEAVMIGAYTSLRDIETSAVILENFGPALREVLEHLIGVQLRNVITIGAHVASRFGFSDIIPTLLAMNASLRFYRGGVKSLWAYMNEDAPERDILLEIVLPKEGRRTKVQMMRLSYNDYSIFCLAASRVKENWIIAAGVFPGRAKLAEKTMVSTSDVAKAIQAIQDSTAKSMKGVENAVGSIGVATDLAGQSGAALQGIVEVVTATADQVNAIAAASEEQSAASEEINRSIVEVNEVSRLTAEAMNQASTAVADLTEQAKKLAALIQEMKQG